MGKQVNLNTYYYKKTEIDSLLNNKANSSHTHGNITSDGKITNQVSKNVVTDANGKITTEAKPTIPSANATATNIKMNGTQSAGSLTTFAKADHVHPVDTSRAAAVHTHDDRYYTETEVNTKLSDYLTTDDASATYQPKGSYLTSHNPVDTALSSTSTNAVQNKVINTALSGKANSSHTHTKSQISDFPTSMTPTSHTHGSISNTGTLNSDITSVNKVVVTDSSNNVKTISKLPLANVTHQDISGKINTSAIKNDLTTGGATNVLSAEQGKQLKAQIDSIVSGETATDHNHDTIYYQKETIDTKLNHKIDSIYITEDLELCYNIDTYFRSYTNNEDIGDLLPNKGHSLAELSVTSDGLLINSSNGEKRFNFPVVNPTELQFTYVSGELRGWVLGTLTDKTSRIWGDNNGTVWKIVNGVDSTQESVSSPTKANGDIIKVTFKDGLISYYKNNALLVSKEYEQVDDELYFGFYTNTNRNLVIKDVIIK